MEHPLILPDQILPQSLFTIAHPGPVLYPTLMAPLLIWHPKAIATVEEILARKQQHLGLLLTRSEAPEDSATGADLFQTGVVVKILKRIKLPDSSIQILVQGLKRFKVRKFLSEHPYFVVDAGYSDDADAGKTL